MTAEQSTESAPKTPPASTPVRLPLGLLGFESTRDYTLVTDPGQAPFSWLQVANDPGLAFLVLSPFEVMGDYELNLTQEEVEFLALPSPREALVYNIVTMRPNGSATINLRGPIVLNKLTMVGKQVVLPESTGYSLQHPLPQEEA